MAVHDLCIRALRGDARPVGSVSVSTADAVTVIDDDAGFAHRGPLDILAGSTPEIPGDRRIADQFRVPGDSGFGIVETAVDCERPAFR
jgi:hypothetical protein